MSPEQSPDQRHQGAEELRTQNPDWKNTGEDMVDETKEEIPTPEELEKEKQEEEELIATPEKAKIREKLIADLELDADVDSALIERLTEKELEDRKRFGKVVGQKRKWREKATKKPETEIKKEQPIKEGEKPLTEKDLEVKLAERDFKRELNDLDISDELRKKVESYARTNNCSPKEAFKSSWIQFEKKQEDEKATQEEAAAGGTRRTRPGKDNAEVTRENFSTDNYDLRTEEGRKACEADRKKAFGI